MPTHSHPSDEEQSHPRRGGGPKFRVLAPGEGTRREPPASLEAEEYLLSCILLDGREVMAAALLAHTSAKSFYDPKHGLIFAVLEDLYRRGLPMEVSVVAEEMKTRDELDRVGGYAFLAQVSSRIPTTAQAAYFIEKVRDYAVARAVIRGCEQVIDGVHELKEGGRELGERLEVHSSWISRQLDTLRSTQATMIEAAKAAYKRTLDKLAGKPDKSRWIFTGLREFDERFGPFDANNEDWLVLIGALPGGAKSSFMRFLLVHNLRAGKTVQVFLLETGVGKLLELLACTATEIPNASLGQLPPDFEARYVAALDEMHGYLGKTLFVCDEVLPCETLIARIDDHARKHGGPADFTAVDHIHLLNALKPINKREAEMGYIGKKLAQCAKRHNRTILGLAQLNRATKTDGKNLRPEPHHLRDSGELEQAARRIVMIHTPDQDMRGADQTKNQDQVMVELYQAKHNNGRTGWREFWFRRSTTKFFDIGDRDLGRSNPAPALVPRDGAPATTKAAFRGGRP